MKSLDSIRRSFDPLQGSPATFRDEFADWYHQTKLPQIRLIALLTMVLYVLYAWMEQDVAESMHGARMTVHGLMIPAALLLVLLMSFFDRLRQPMVFLLATAPVASTAANLWLNSHHQDFVYFLPELYFIIIWTFTISGLKLRLAILTASGSTLLILVVTLAGTIAPGIERLHLIWLMAAFSFGIVNAYILERAHKVMFINHKELALSASTDGLTGLWNRSRIEQLFNEECLRANRYGTPFSVILIDIDHFKQVNDTFGHTVGDTVLRQFAALLRNNVRQVDQVGRLGGEEFLIVLPETGQKQAHEAAEILRQRINRHEFDTVQSKTASFGVTQYRGDETLQRMLDRVDQALYAAKNKGRDRVEVL
ncbi:diguanylate cyclase (GGDEF) domain-containing protein [Halopseudomonas xinjiangensis]|uniref:diguanylate cyclase n=1 Tax=Halopseudomonas xinjiangensis TaxID=487184 RepID=A0A1H1PD85_9GAMM|nr:diguanylate cyclase (GGDEF) domain-containing protein [Halopseudomonas xinjiangensis]